MINICKLNFKALTSELYKMSAKQIDKNISNWRRILKWNNNKIIF